jgi:hypothetical protein
MTTPAPAGPEPQDDAESAGEPGPPADDLDADKPGDGYEPV